MESAKFIFEKSSGRFTSLQNNGNYYGHPDADIKELELFSVLCCMAKFQNYSKNEKGELIPMELEELKTYVKRWSKSLSDEDFYDAIHFLFSSSVCTLHSHIHGNGKETFLGVFFSPLNALQADLEEHYAYLKNQ